MTARARGNFILSSSPDFSAQQLADARAAAWHQDGNPIATGEAAAAWIDSMGLVPFSPRAQQLGAPAASLVEATLGVANDAPTAAESEMARGFVARLTAKGSVVPLNLLGTAGDMPDFLASARAFSFIFTLRGDKSWKQPPATSGNVKVSPLGLRVFESLTEKGAQTAAELATDLGREVNELAIARSLSELWSQLRVLPQLQLDGTAARWELSTQRFTKAIKSGANAGQPTALSGLLSLYLSQALLATEEEIAAYLSPLSPRARVRDAVHGLTAGRQLEAVVLEGKTLLHVAGSLPSFALPVAAESTEDVSEDNDAEVLDGVDAEATPAFPKPKKIGTGRISTFKREGAAGGERSAYAGKRTSAGDGERKPYERKPYERKTFGDRKPAGRTFSGERKPYVRRDDNPGAPRLASETWDRPRKPFNPDGAAPRPERERRPFVRRDSAEGSSAPRSFAKPWDENKPKRPYTPRSADGEGGERKPYERKPYERKPFDGERKPYERKTFSGGARKPFDGARKPFDGERKPFTGTRKPYAPRTREAGDGPPRERSSSFAPRAPRSFDGPRKPYVRRDDAGGSAPRKPYVRRDDAGSSAPRKPYVRRDDAGGGAPRKTFRPRAEGDFAPRPKTFGAKSFGEKKSFGDKKPFGDRKSFGDKKPFGAKSFGDKKPFGGKSFGSKPSGGFGARKPGGPPKSFGGAKSFGGGKSFGSARPRTGGAGKPFGSRPPAKRAPSRAPKRETEE